MIRKWKTVDTLTIRKIAHKSTSGVIFSTCSKSDIIESISRKHCGYTKNVKMFIFLMEKASQQMTSIKEKYSAMVAQMINESVSEFEKAEIKICEECADTYENCDCHEDDGTPIRHR